MLSTRILHGLFIASLVSVLVACGGGGSSSGPDDGKTNPEPEPEPDQVARRFSVGLAIAEVYQLSNGEEVSVDTSEIVVQELTFEP